MDHFAIIGAGFGDEGKGQTINDIAHYGGSDIWILKYNGTANDGHTVVDTWKGKDINYAFEHLTPAVLKSGILSTFTENYYLHPMKFVSEREKVSNLTNGRKPSGTASCSKDCPIITLYDVLISQQLQRNLGLIVDDAGYAEAIHRTTNTEFGLTVGDYNKGTEKYLSVLFDIKNIYVPKRLKELGIDSFDPDLYRKYSNEGCLYRFSKDFESMCKRLEANFYSNSWHNWTENIVIYEGNYGLLTDDNCGLKRVIDLWKIGSGGNQTLHVIYVTRCYTTKKGPGVLPFELDEPPYDISDDSGMRYSYLNFDLIEEAINKDKEYAKDYSDIKFTGLITCCDQTYGHPIKYIQHGVIKNCPNLDVLIEKFQDIVGGEVTTRGSLDEPRQLYMLDDWKQVEENTYW